MSKSDSYSDLIGEMNVEKPFGWQARASSRIEIRQQPWRDLLKKANMKSIFANFFFGIAIVFFGFVRMFSREEWTD